MQLVRANAFLARGHKVKTENPFIQRDVAAFHDRADCDGKRLTASVALVQARTVGPALNERGLIHNAAMRANRTIWPMQLFEMLPRLVGVGENRKRQISHGRTPTGSLSQRYTCRGCGHHWDAEGLRGAGAGRDGYAGWGEPPNSRSKKSPNKAFSMLSV